MHINAKRIKPIYCTEWFHFIVDTMRSLCILFTICLCVQAVPDSVTGDTTGIEPPVSIVLQAALSNARTAIQINKHQLVDFHDRIIAELRQTLCSGTRYVRLIGIRGDLQLLTTHLHQLAEEYYQWLQQQNSANNRKVFAVFDRVTDQLSAALRLNGDQQRRLAEITSPWHPFILALGDIGRRMYVAVHRTIEDFGRSALRLQQRRGLQRGLDTLYEFGGETIVGIVDDIFSYPVMNQMLEPYKALLTRLSAGQDIKSILRDLEKYVYRYN